MSTQYKSTTFGVRDCKFKGMFGEIEHSEYWIFENKSIIKNQAQNKWIECILNQNMELKSFLMCGNIYSSGLGL